MSVFVDPPPYGPVLEGPHVHPGFGLVTLYCDGVEALRDVEGAVALATYEQAAAATPGAWLLKVEGPFATLTYKWSDGAFRLATQGDGFA